MVFVQEQWKRDRLADALDDTPETVIPVHFLRRGLADAWVAGTPPRFDGVIVQAHLLPQEPWCFGRDPSVIWGLLRPLIDWGRQIILAERARRHGLPVGHPSLPSRMLMSSVPAVRRRVPHAGRAS